jgi:hypothetical protein
MKNDTRKEEKTGFTAPDNGLIRAVAPNISWDSSSVNCFTLMFANELFNTIVTETNRYYQHHRQEEEEKTLQPDVTLFEIYNFVALIIDRPRWSWYHEVLLVNQRIVPHPILLRSHKTWPVSTHDEISSFWK